MSLVLNKLVFGSQITCQSYIFVTIGFTRITDEVTNKKTRWQRPSWGTKISLNVCRDDFFSVAKFDIFSLHTCYLSSLASRAGLRPARASLGIIVHLNCICLYCINLILHCIRGIVTKDFIVLILSYRVYRL